jgi:2-C-methyl-D-erythritol 2,4-cyclodiphosphate synthase
MLNLEQKSNQEVFKLQKTNMQYPRIGTGFDVHAFGEGNFVVLGGVSIPYKQGLIAHSDGDVLLHAIMDALLGALALGDIGKHFPDTDKKWQGANSRDLLKAVNALIKQQGYQVGNIDSTIIAQAPKMAPYILEMQANIAKDLELDISDIGVKATTTEKLGFTGRKEGIACQASAILVPLSSGASL